MVACWCFIFANQNKKLSKKNKKWTHIEKLKCVLISQYINLKIEIGIYFLQFFLFQSCWNNRCCSNMSIGSCKDSITKLNSFYSTGSCRWNTWSIKCIIRWIIETRATKKIMYNYFKKKTSGMLIKLIFFIIIILIASILLELTLYICFIWLILCHIYGEVVGCTFSMYWVLISCWLWLFCAIKKLLFILLSREKN